MILQTITLALLWLSLIAYAVLGGADFGGGVWDFLAGGPRAEEQRRLIGKAIGPVWEANNVWIVYLIVGLYTAFPTVAYILTVVLFFPFALALIGIVLRGAAFAFRAHFARAAGSRVIWGRIFSTASVITPFLFGMCAAAVASERLHYHDGQVQADLWASWLNPFAAIIGAIALSLCAVLAAVYLTIEAQRYAPELTEGFRRKALIAGAVTAGFGALGLILAPSQAPLLWQGMLHQALPVALATMVVGLGTAAALWYRRFGIARALVVLMTALLLGAWGLAQLPYIIPPDVTVAGAASPPATLEAFLISAAVGMAILLPSLYLLFRVFKGQNPVPRVHQPELEEA